MPYGSGIYNNNNPLAKVYGGENAVSRAYNCEDTEFALGPRPPAAKAFPEVKKSELSGVWRIASIFPFDGTRA